MKAREIHIKKYDWQATIFYAVSCYHTDIIMEALTSVEAPEKIMNRVYENLTKCSMDTGFTYSAKSQRATIMVIGLHSSPAQFLNSLEHELRHLIDDIADYHDLDMGGEEVAYLTGDINEMIVEDIQHFICQCRCHSKKQKCGCQH